MLGGVASFAASIRVFVNEFTAASRSRGDLRACRRLVLLWTVSLNVSQFVDLVVSFGAFSFLIMLSLIVNTSGEWSDDESETFCRSM